MSERQPNSSFPCVIQEYLADPRPYMQEGVPQGCFRCANGENLPNITVEPPFAPGTANAVVNNPDFTGDTCPGCQKITRFPFIRPFIREV